MIKIITHIIISSCMLVIFTANDARPASISEFFFEYNEGMICLKGNNISIMPLLEKITEVSSIEIFVIDGIGSRSINADFKDRSLEDALKSILKDCNYAIVYCEDKSSKGKITILKMSTFSAGKNNAPDLAAGKTYRSKKRKISNERTKQVMNDKTGRRIDAFMRQAGSLTPEQIKTLPSPIYSDSQHSSRSRGANAVSNNRERNGNGNRDRNGVRVHGKFSKLYPVLGKIRE